MEIFKTWIECLKRTLFLSNSLWHESSESGVTSEGGHGVAAEIGASFAVSLRDFDVTVWGSTSLSPDDDGASWELWEFLWREALDLLEVSIGSELSSSLISGVSVKESTNNGVNSIGDSGVAFSDGAILCGNLLLLLSKSSSLGGSRRDTAEVLESNSLVDCVWRATEVLESGFVIQRLDHKTVSD